MAKTRRYWQYRVTEVSDDYDGVKVGALMLDRWVGRSYGYQVWSPGEDVRWIFSVELVGEATEQQYADLLASGRTDIDPKKAGGASLHRGRTTVVDPPVIWVVVGNDGRPGYIADEGDQAEYDIGPNLAAELRERDARLVRYAPTSRAEPATRDCTICSGLGVRATPCAHDCACCDGTGRVPASRAKGDS